MNLIESRIDLAIRTGNDPDPALIAPPLAVCESVLVAAPVYLKEHGKPGHPTDLAGHRCLGHANVGRSTWVFQRGEVTETVNVWTAFTWPACVL